jgi:hypothetical protein
VAVEDPHLVLIVAAAVHSFCAFARLGWPFPKRGQQLLFVVALVFEHLLELALADVLALPGVAAVVDVFTAGRVGEEIPEVNAL